MLAKIPIKRIEFFIQLEPFVGLLLATLCAWAFYVLFLKRISDRRHVALKRRFIKTLIYLFISASLALFHWAVISSVNNDLYLTRLVNFIAFIAFIILVSVAIRLAQIYVYLYLFFSNIKTGVPRLIANLFTLLFSTVLISWLAAEVFNVHLATVLTTSAIFTIVLGLALQDTLGNLFSGVALQMERPFQIDDWVEIHSGAEIWSGQVFEITWRSTSLIGFNDQLIIIPNKTLAQGQISVFSNQAKTPRLYQQFRLRFEASIEDAKLAMLEGISNVEAVLHDPAPKALVSEVTEGWIFIRIYYSLRDYGQKLEAADQVIINILESMKNKGIRPGTNVVRVGTWHQETTPPSID